MSFSLHFQTTIFQSKSQPELSRSLSALCYRKASQDFLEMTNFDNNFPWKYDLFLLQTT